MTKLELIGIVIIAYLIIKIIEITIEKIEKNNVRKHIKESLDDELFKLLSESKKELEEEQEKSRSSEHFNVGDKVKAVSNGYRHTSLFNEWEGVVTDVREERFSAKTTNSKDEECIGVEFDDLFYHNFAKVNKRGRKKQGE